jgi:Uma2 family endonuclease
MTVDDLETMPDDGNRYEVIEGELFVSRSPGLTHQIVSDNIVFLIRDYLRSHPVGVVVSTPGLIFSQFSGVIPDIVYFSNPSRERVVSGDRLISAPDLVIEILSRGSENVRRDRIAKRRLYSKHGVPEYWIVDRHDRVVEIYRLEGALLELAVTLKDNDEVSTPALPGFSYLPAEIFKEF